MQQTKPFFILKKYRSILRAAIIIEAVNFIVSLTDSIVAGNAVGAEAFAAIGLIAPLLSVSVFLSNLINTGTVLNFSYSVGKFDKKRANEFFSQGMYMAVLIGALYALILFWFGDSIVNVLAASGEIRQYLNDYYYVILFFFFLNPICLLLDSLLIADGAEKLSVAANMIQIICNVILSVVFVQFWGVVGIAIASVACKFLFVLLVCMRFVSPKNTLKLLPYWKLSDFITIVKSGFVKATTYAFEAILTFVINAFALSYFGSDALIVTVVIEKLLALLTLFMGVSMACQPLISTLRGERNTKALRVLMKTAVRDLFVVGIALSLIIITFAPLIAGIFGISEGGLFDQTVAGLKIVSLTLVFHAVLLLFFAYYIFVGKQLLAFIICLINNLLSTTLTPIALSVIMKSSTGLWIGFALAPVLATGLSALIVFCAYKRKNFPLLIPRDSDDRIQIYDFKIDVQSAVELSKTVERSLKDASVLSKASVFGGVITEDILMLISDKNSDSGKPLYAECTIITEGDGVRVILRDSGVIFDITDTDGDVDSFRQYIVSNLMVNHDRKLYMTTTGYNRNELFFSNS